VAARAKEQKEGEIKRPCTLLQRRNRKRIGGKKCRAMNRICKNRERRGSHSEDWRSKQFACGRKFCGLAPKKAGEKLKKSWRGIRQAAGRTWKRGGITWNERLETARRASYPTAEWTRKRLATASASARDRKGQ